MSASISVRSEVCTGCTACVPACPFGSISMVDGLAVIDETCTLCGACQSSCPYEAIIIRRNEIGTDDIGNSSGIMVLAEQRDGTVDHSTLELLGEARRLSTAEGGKVSAVLLTAVAGNWPETLIHHGADRVFVAEDPTLAHFRTEPFAKVVERLLRDQKPAVVLAAATTT